MYDLLYLYSSTCFTYRVNRVQKQKWVLVERLHNRNSCKPTFFLTKKKILLARFAMFDSLMLADIVSFRMTFDSNTICNTPSLIGIVRFSPTFDSNIICNCPSLPLVNIYCLFLHDV